MSVREDLKQDGKSVVTEFTKDGVTIQLVLETATFPEGYDPKEELTLRTHLYEIGARGIRFEYDLTYNINHIDGVLFRLPPSQFETETTAVSCVSLLTEWHNDGSITVPDEPFDSAEFRLESGVYRAYDVQTVVDKDVYDAHHG